MPRVYPTFEQKFWSKIVRRADHLCENTSCVNPAHLEPVTQAENAQRSADLRIA